MADRKISVLASLAKASVAAASDYLPIVDISETVAADKNKKIVVNDIVQAALDALSIVTASGSVTVATVQGSAAASGNLALSSTSDATKGLITLGTASTYDEVNDRLGIGTQSPSATLHLKATNNILQISESTGNSAAYLDIGASGQTNAWLRAPESMVFVVDSDNSQSDRSFQFSHDDGSGTLMKITETGFVGIGQSTPTYPLEVTSTNAAGQIIFGDTGSSYYGRLACDDAGNTIVGLYNSYDNAAARMDFGFGVAAPTSTTPKMTILGNGSVGIGTATPSKKLDLYRSDDGIIGLRIQKASGYWDIENRGDWSGDYDGALTFSNGGDELVTFLRSGDVGVKTSAPNKALEINSATGANLRLTYNDSDGLAANYADFSTTSGGDLTIAPSGGDTNVTGNLTISGLTKRSVIAGITASTTQSQGQGALTKDINEISTVGTANDVVTLPAAEAGLEIFIINNGANLLQIFPASGDDLGAGVNASTTLAPGSNATFVSYDATNWEVK